MTETDNLLMSALTHNPQPLHLDAEAAAASEFGRILVNGTFTFALMIGLSVADTTFGRLIANLGYDKVLMPSPVFVGDTLRAESEVVSLRDSRSRPNAGIVVFRHRLLNQRGQTVCECLRTAIVSKRLPSERRSEFSEPGLPAAQPAHFGAGGGPLSGGGA